MKRILSLLVMGILSLTLVACRDTDTAEQPKEEVKQEETQLSEENFEKAPSNLNQEIGSGDLTLSTQAGTSKDNKAVVFVGSDTVLEQIGLDAFEFDGSKMSYIYIDGNLYTKEQLGDTQTVLELQEDTLKPGIHTVEVVQYDKDTADGKPVTYKAAKYEIKEK